MQGNPVAVHKRTGWTSDPVEGKVSAMKGIVSDIIPEGLEPYGELDPNHKIDAVVSSIGFYRRMCLDFAKVGGLCKMTIERKKQLKRDYLEKCKAELRK